MAVHKSKISDKAPNFLRLDCLSANTRRERSIMSYLEWKSFEKSRLEEELGLEEAGELKSASELLLSCRRLKARKPSKSKKSLFIKSELSIWA